MHCRCSTLYHCVPQHRSAVISLVRHRAVHGENEGQQRWRSLVSFLVYCIPLNLMNIPVCASAIALFLCGVFPKQMTCALLRFRLSCQGELFIVQVRTIIISLSTIVALAPYRRAAIELICRKHNTQILPSMEVTVAVDCLNSRRRCRFIAHSGDTFGVDATLTQVEAYPCRR
uniref:Secreted protein n=2 Tax=Parascaris univalens TaxID=6257 RepID=A0A915BX04_PARUN